MTVNTLIKKIQSSWKIITAIVAIIVAIATTYHSVMKKYESIMETLKTTQQMSLKSVIWNEDIPMQERMSACDVYLNAGYNSMTKKKCETILNNM